MIKKFIFFIPIFFTLGLFTWYIFNKKNTSPPIIVFTLYKESGRVMSKSKTGDYEAMTSDTLTLPSGSSIKTEVGVAHAILSDNSTISIDSGSEITIEDNSNTKTAIMQYAGKTWHRVEKLLGRTYEVETPTTVAVVRGTKFGVEVSDDESKTSEVYVTENAVAVSRISIIDGKKELLFTKTLNTNDSASVSLKDTNTEIQSKPIDDSLKNRPWVKRVEKLDKILDRQKPEDAIPEIIREIKTNPEMIIIERTRNEEYIEQKKSRSTPIDRVPFALPEIKTEASIGAKMEREKSIELQRNSDVPKVDPKTILEDIQVKRQHPISPTPEPIHTKTFIPTERTTPGTINQILLLTPTQKTQSQETRDTTALFLSDMIKKISRETSPKDEEKEYKNYHIENETSPTPRSKDTHSSNNKDTRE